MSENNSGAGNSEQNRDNKRQRFDPAKQEGGRPRSRNQNHRRRNNGPRQGGNDNNKRNENAEIQAEGKVQNQNQGRNPDRQNNNRNKNNKFKREQNQGGEKKQSDSQNFKPKNKRPAREFGDEVAKNVKKVETIDDIRSDNARITKEIYLEIASLKNINLN